MAKMGYFYIKHLEGDLRSNFGQASGQDGSMTALGQPPVWVIWTSEMRDGNLVSNIFFFTYGILVILKKQKHL
jgi:hypothetical protein